MPNLTVAKAKEQLESVKNRLKSFGEKHKEAIKKAGKTAKNIGGTIIAGGTSYGLSYAMARLDDTEVGGVPYDLALSVAAGGASIFIDNEAANFALNSVSTGAFCTFASRKGTEHGTAARLKDAAEAVAEGGKP